MNSLFGILFHIMEKTGLSYNELMYKISWVTIQMMLADSPRLVKKSEIVRKVSGRELFGLIGK